MTVNSKKSNAPKDGSSQTPKRAVDVAGIVTNRFIEQLAKDIIPWRTCFTTAGLPTNLVTQRPYRGINVWLLAMLGYSRNWFITSRQLKELEGVAKEEEKGTQITFWNWKEVTDEDSGEIKNVPFLRYYYVLNIDQCDAIPEAYLPEPLEKITDPSKRFEEIVARMPEVPDIKFKEKTAKYDPCLDTVTVPKIETFESSEAYYDMLFHQLVHSTGHVSRLNRKELMMMAEFWTDQYSIEELVAEMASCYLRSLCGFTGAGMKKPSMEAAMKWQEKFKNDKNLLIYAGTKMQQAIDYILNIKPKEIVCEQTTVATVSDEAEEPPF